MLTPCFLAGIVSMPFLATLYSAIGILGAWPIAVQLIGVGPANFWSIMWPKVGTRAAWAMASSCPSCSA